jgi:hypothetical protein
MSTTTNFKRIALVAVAALGMGVLSSAPSQAAIGSSTIVMATTAGTAGLNPATLDNTDTATGALVSVQFLASVANTDSVTIQIAAKSKPNSTVSYPKALLYLVDTATNSTAVTAVRIDSRTSLVSTQTSDPQLAGATGAVRTQTTTSFGVDDSGTAAVVSTPTANSYVYAQFRVFLDTATTRATGSYVYTVIATPFESSMTATTASVKTIDITIVVGAAGTTVASGGSSFASMISGSSYGSNIAAAVGKVDSEVSAVATASTTPRAVIRVGLRTSTNTTTASESVTVTMTGAGSSGVTSGTSVGRSATYAYTEAARIAGYLEIFIYSDGSAGNATVAISTTSVTFATKTVSFYAAAPATLVASVATPLLRVGTVGTNADAVRVIAKDANGISYSGPIYLYASDAASAITAGAVRATDAASALLCGWDAGDDRHECSLPGNLAGTGKFKATNYATAALATAAASGVEVTSNEVTVTVSQGTVAKVALSFDKATYAPNERMRIYITPQDAAGNSLPAGTYANIFASGGISTTALTTTGVATGAAAVDLSLVSADTVGNNSSTTGAKAGTKVFTVYAPANGGTVTITATGGTSLPAAGRVAVTATATVTDSGAAALAAVTALATTVASLKTLITTLTNLVLKIQKKVKA